MLATVSGVGMVDVNLAVSRSWTFRSSKDSICNVRGDTNCVAAVPIPTDVEL